MIKKTIEEMHEQIVAQTIELEQLENVKREAPPLIPPRSPGGTMTLADGTVIRLVGGASACERASARALGSTTLAE